ncbi:hypothetical protein [Salinibaculum rarum]|uniref:hypothetical protein n=1 Tax=Salinibaculum rarum TaxID=3058903 RepID=UPI0026605389|nr:hypothetical protein [Salinibaculum sp. KK48]
MELVWYLDRATALVAYPALYLAVLSGIFYNTEQFASLHRAARRVHIEVSVLAMLVTLAHGLLGVLDTYLVASGQVPQPSYSLEYLLVGVAVGAGALLLVVVAVLGFLSPHRFDSPWGPTVVHAFAYAGFAFATIHAAAVGTDVVSLLSPLCAASLAFLGYVLLLRLLVSVRPALFPDPAGDRT